MKIECHLEGPHVRAWFATAVLGYTEARAKDDAEWHAKYGASLTASAASVPFDTAAGEAGSR